MKVFIAYKFSDSDKIALRRLLEELPGRLEELGYETFSFFRDIQKWGDKNIDRRDIIPLALEQIDACDIVFLMVDSSEKSTGMGIEAGYAKANDKTIFLAKRLGSEADYLESLADKTITFDGDTLSLELLGKLFKT